MPSRREFLDLATRAAALPGAAEFFPAWLQAAQQHPHSPSSAAPPEPGLLRKYKPKFFEPEDFAALQAFAEILIPTDDTPGARKHTARTTSILFCKLPLSTRLKFRSSGARPWPV